MAITHDYVDYATGNDYKGASFTDGAFTVADMTLTKAGAFAASKANHWLYLDDNGSGEITTGYYRIASVTSSDAVVLAASPKSGASDPTDVKCTQHDGSALLPWRSDQGACDLLTRNTTDGNQVNVVTGTAVVHAAALDLTTLIAAGALNGYCPLIFRGCTAVADDGGIGEIDCNGVTMFAATTYDYIILRDLEIHSGGDNHMVVLDTYATVVNCELHKGASSPSTKDLLKISTDAQVLGCYFHDAGTNGRCLELTSGVLVHGNHFNVGAAALGVICSGNPAHAAILRNVFRLAATGAYGVYAANVGVIWILENSFYNSAAGTNWAVNVAGWRYNCAVVDNIIEGFSGAGGEGVNVAASSGMNTFGYNAFYNCTANYTLGDVTHVDLGNNDTLGASPFVDAANGDFDINGTVSGVTEDAYPAAFLGLASTSPKADKGAVQAGGGGGEAHLDSEVLDTAKTPGTYHAPDAAEVISTAVFGVNSGTSGTYHAPEVSEVIDTASFGAASAETGTVHLPDAAEVIDTAVFGAASAVSGTWHAPDAAEVIDSAVFGPSSSIAGTYDTSGAAPTAAEIADAVWDELRNEHTGAGSFGAVSEWASTGGLDAAGVRAAVGLAAANLDTQLAPLADLATDDEIAAKILETPANLLKTDASGRVEVSGTKNTLDSLSGADGDTLKDLSDQIDGVGTGITALATSAALATVDGVVYAILEDTGTTLPAAIAAISAGAGSGTGTYTDTVTDGTNPLDGVRVQLSTDSVKANPVYQAYTNALGVFLFHPDPGAYYVWFEKAGYDFSAVNGTGVTVT